MRVVPLGTGCGSPPSYGDGGFESPEVIHNVNYTIEGGVTTFSLGRVNALGGAFAICYCNAYDASYEFSHDACSIARPCEHPEDFTMVT